MKKNIKCVIFDLDGTLIDSGPDLLDTLNFIFAKESLKKIPKEIIGDLVGSGAEAMIRKGLFFLNQEMNDQKIKILVNDFIDYYSKNCTNKTTLYSGALDVLNHLKKNNIKICLCTNKKKFLAEKIINDFKLDNYFDYIAGSDGKVELKPHTEMLIYCIQELQIKENETMFIGDSNNDIIPANKLGMYSVYVKFGYGKLNENVKPNLIIKKLKDLIN